MIPQLRFTRGNISGLPRFAYSLRPASLLAPLYGSDQFPAVGDFYVQAFGGSVTLPTAGYNYSSGWTPLLAGLSPAGTTTSLAARPLRFPDDPSCASAPFQDPGRTDAPSPIAVASGAAAAVGKAKAPA